MAPSRGCQLPRVPLALALAVTLPLRPRTAAFPVPEPVLLRCPDQDGRWSALLGEATRAFEVVRLPSAGGYAAARRSLADALDVAIGHDLPRALECSLGVAAAYRVLALAHALDPTARAGASWGHALGIALRFQQLAAGWLIYAYNNDANHDAAFIDGSSWPLNAAEFDEEQRGVRAAFDAASLAHSPAPEVQSGLRIPGFSLAVVTVCAYPPENQLPRLATSVQQIYASRHGYAYLPRLDSPAAGRPPAWGKVRAMQEVLEDGSWEWVLWVDCDIYFMNLTTTVDSLLLRYGGVLAGEGVDPDVHLLLTEDKQMLNTAIFLMRKSQWSLDLLNRVWGSEDSPFINHTWWEQAAFAQELLGSNHRRFAAVQYGPGKSHGDGSGGSDGGGLEAYPPQVRVLPQTEMNSYHPISSAGGDSWQPGQFVLSFNGVQSLSGPTLAGVLHANYYELFCSRNAVEALCHRPEDTLFAPWLADAGAG